MKKAKKVDTISTFMGADTSFEGTLAFEGAIRLDGKVKGQIVSAAGTAIVGEKAVVEADINVGVAIIKGEVSGRVEARERIEVHPPGRVTADLEAPIIMIQPGVNFNGNCRMPGQSRKVSAAVADKSV